MKEYLAKMQDGSYKLIPSKMSEDDIEVPEWANYAYDNDPGVCFLKGAIGHNHPLLIWQRESINDKVVSAEVARQELKGVDNVNHPQHYTSDPSGIECIEITRHRNFNIGNAIKYLWRNGLKDSDSQIQDLEKAIWYIQDEINRLSK